MDYCATHPDAVIRFYRSDMQLHVHSDASYLTAPQGRSRYGGHFFLSNRYKPKQPIQHNGPIHVNVGILKNVVASAAESEIGASYENAQTATQLTTTLEEMGHKQDATPFEIDNSVAEAIIKGTCKQKLSKTFDMRYYWLEDQWRQGKFNFYWAPGTGNLGDFHTKVHAPKHYKQTRPIYLHTKDSPKVVLNSFSSSALQGCVELQSPLGGTVAHPRTRAT